MGGRLADGSVVCLMDGLTDRWMDRWMDGPDSSVVCIVSVSTHVTFIWTAISTSMFLSSCTTVQ